MLIVLLFPLHFLFLSGVSMLGKKRNEPYLPWPEFANTRSLSVQNGTRRRCPIDSKLADSHDGERNGCTVPVTLNGVS